MNNKLQQQLLLTKYTIQNTTHEQLKTRLKSIYWKFELIRVEGRDELLLRFKQKGERRTRIYTNKEELIICEFFDITR